MTAPSPLSCSQVRPARAEDLVVIHEWLQQQQAAGVEGTFLCNWSITKEVFEEGRLEVFDDDAAGGVVAYQFGGLIRNGILEVKADQRVRGVGTAFVRHMLAQAYAENEDILVVECSPTTSVPFWKQMGFTVLETAANEKLHATRILRRRWDMAAGEDSCNVDIAIYPECKQWDLQTQWLQRRTLVGTTAEGVVHLPERVHWRSSWADSRDEHNAVLSIEVDGRQVYVGKIRSAKAADLGVRECGNGYFLDAVSLRR